MFSGSISTNSCQMLYVPFEQKVIQPAVEYFKIHFRNASADPWSSFMKGTKGGLPITIRVCQFLFFLSRAESKNNCNKKCKRGLLGCLLIKTLVVDGRVPPRFAEVLLVRSLRSRCWGRWGREADVVLLWSLRSRCRGRWGRFAVVIEVPLLRSLRLWSWGPVAEAAEIVLLRQLRLSCWGRWGRVALNPVPWSEAGNGRSGSDSTSKYE